MQKFSRRRGRCRTLLFNNGRADSKRLRAIFSERETSSLNHKTRLQSFPALFGPIASVNGMCRNRCCSSNSIASTPRANRQVHWLKWAKQIFLDCLATRAQGIFLLLIRGTHS